MEPDVAGFVAAQDELREKLGTTVQFITEIPAQYPPGTAMDRRGRPLDPTAEPLPGTGIDTEQAVKATTVFRGTDPEGEAIGWMEGTTLMLDVGIADWNADGVQNATRVRVAGELYDIRGAVADGFADPNRVRLFAVSVT